MTASAMEMAVAALRQADLFPSPRRLAVAALALSEPGPLPTGPQLVERAQDAGFCLPLDQAAATLAELRAAGALPGSISDGGRADPAGRAVRPAA